MVFPTKRRRSRCMEGEGGVDNGNNQQTTNLPSGSQPQPKRAVGKLLTLSADQTKDFNFPVGCPVWYNFSQAPGRRGLCFNEGVVSSVNLDIVSKSLVFEVERKSEEKSSQIDTVFEDDIAYAANCPVFLLSGTNDEQRMNGQILVANPMKSDGRNSAFSYTVKISKEDSQALFCIENDVMAERLRYRKIEVQPLPKPKGKQDLVMHDSQRIPMLSPDNSFQGNPEDHAPRSDIVSDDGENDYQKTPRTHNRPSKSRPSILRGQSKLLKREFGSDDTPRKSTKRKTENVKNESEKKSCWETLHSSYENDGAI